MLSRLLRSALGNLVGNKMNELEVVVQQGKLKGKTGTDYSGNTFYSFQGIPYAKPPTGNLRFKVIPISCVCMKVMYSRRHITPHIVDLNLNIKCLQRRKYVV